MSKPWPAGQASLLGPLPLPPLSRSLRAAPPSTHSALALQHVTAPPRRRRRHGGRRGVVVVVVARRGRPGRRRGGRGGGGALPAEGEERGREARPHHRRLGRHRPGAGGGGGRPGGPGHARGSAGGAAAGRGGGGGPGGGPAPRRRPGARAGRGHDRLPAGAALIGVPAGLVACTAPRSATKEEERPRATQA